MCDKHSTYKATQLCNWYIFIFLQIFFAREPVKLWSERNESTKTQIVNPPHKLLDAMANNTEDANCDSCSDVSGMIIVS